MSARNKVASRLFQSHAALCTVRGWSDVTGMNARGKANLNASAVAMVSTSGAVISEAHRVNASRASKQSRNSFPRWVPQRLSLPLKICCFPNSNRSLTETEETRASCEVWKSGLFSVCFPVEAFRASWFAHTESFLQRTQVRFCRRRYKNVFFENGKTAARSKKKKTSMFRLNGKTNAETRRKNALAWTWTDWFCWSLLRITSHLTSERGTP